MVQQLAVVAVVLIASSTFTFGQTTRVTLSNEIALDAFSYFQKVNGQQFDEYLSRIRPDALAPELRTRILNMLPKTDLLNPSSDELAKIKTLNTILAYHQRDSVITIKVLRANSASAVFVAGAAVLITRPALKLLTSEELQAVVAHELGHEYYWNKFELARQNGNFASIRELELRCDGIAVVTLHHLGLNPESLISAITKLSKQNQLPESATQNYVALIERTTFIWLMLDLVGT